MGGHIKEILKMIRERAMEYLYRKTGGSMKATGRMENNMVKELLYKVMGLR